MSKTFHNKLWTALYCVLSAATICVFNVNAEAEDLVVSTKLVRFADLNVNSPDGARALYMRIRTAAHEVCRLPFESNRFAALRERDCMDRAIDSAVRDVHAPELTALRFGSETRLAQR
jgi:UrcA family protein